MAADQGALFEQEETLTVAQVTTRLVRAISGAFPAEVWVRGEVEGLRPPTAGGNVYLSLCEKARGRDTATINAVLLRGSRQRIDRALAEHPGFRLAAGLEVRVRGRVQLAYGRVQLAISEIDPAHTLGRLAAARDRTLQALRAEGLLERNRAVPMPAAPLRVAVVTSDGSAACHDVLHELEVSGLGFAVLLADARVQGHGAEASVLAGLTRAFAARPDVVLLVRGGGSRTDLATFDAERIARLIASVPVPVLTGIGHEIDSSVADAVAHVAHKTPTACAAAVVEQVRATAARGEIAWAAVVRAADAASRQASGALAVQRDALAAAGTSGLRSAEVRLDARATTVSHRAALSLAAAERDLVDAGRRAARSAEATLGGAAAAVARASLQVDPKRLARVLQRHEVVQAGAEQRLRRGSTRVPETSLASLEVLAARAAGVDPARALARGWSITRTAGGALVRDPGDAPPGTVLHTTLAGGTLSSTVDPSAEQPTEPETPT